jgi:hypothetical protein
MVRRRGGSWSSATGRWLSDKVGTSNSAAATAGDTPVMGNYDGRDVPESGMPV